MRLAGGCLSSGRYGISHFTGDISLHQTLTYLISLTRTTGYLNYCYCYRAPVVQSSGGWLRPVRIVIYTVTVGLSGVYTRATCCLAPTSNMLPATSNMLSGNTLLVADNMLPVSRQHVSLCIQQQTGNKLATILLTLASSMLKATCRPCVNAALGWLCGPPSADSD